MKAMETDPCIVGQWALVDNQLVWVWTFEQAQTVAELNAYSDQREFATPKTAA
jgi:hypothetical protein